MPDELYNVYVRHVHGFVRSIGKRTLGFQESMRSGIDRDHVIMYWISKADWEAAPSRYLPTLRR